MTSTKTDNDLFTRTPANIPANVTAFGQYYLLHPKSYWK